MPAWVITLVVGFVIRQIKDYGANLDWAHVKELVAQALAPLPDFIERACVQVANAAIDVLAQVLQSEHLSSIAAKLASGDVAGALAELKDLIMQLVHPTNPSLATHLVQACDDHLCHVQAAA
jgi:hypothetical protein